MSIQRHSHPLSASHYDDIMAALRHIADANEVIRKAQAAGYDVRPHIELANYYLAHFEGIRQQFFPNGRPQ